MAHFAQLDESNIVLQVIVVSNDVLIDEHGVESEAEGVAFCEAHYGGRWIQTSYSARTRKNYAGIDFVFDPIRDAFIPPQPSPEWTLNEETCRWEAPGIDEDTPSIIEPDAAQSGEGL